MKVKCSYCGSTFDQSKLKTKVKFAGEKKEEKVDSKNSYKGKSYTCSQCGATLLTFDETAITFCSYCGSQAMIESKMMEVNNPDYIIPFQKTKEECINNYKKKIRKSFFAPSYMKSDIVVKKVRGIYMPYIIYNLECHKTYPVKGSKVNHHKGDYTYFDDYDVITKVDTNYTGISYDLVSKYYDKYSEMIPFDFKNAIKFNANYLPGFYADTTDIDKSTYDQMVYYLVKNDWHQKLGKIKEFKAYSVNDINVPFKYQRKTGIFPVYFLSIKDKKNKHINYAVVNGQTGQVAADIPIDFKKYIILTLLISIILFLIFDNFLLFIPQTILIFSLLASLISLLISNRQLNLINGKRKHLEDLGYVSKDEETHKEEIKVIKKTIKKKYEKLNNKKNDTFITLLKIPLFMSLYPLIVLLVSLTGGLNLEEAIKNVGFSFLIKLLIYEVFCIPALLIDNIIRRYQVENELLTKKWKMPFMEKMSKYLYKQVVAIVIGIIILCINPVDDNYYYCGAILCFLLIAYTFYDLIKERNEITSNELPQLEKRGGDEND